MIKYLTVRSACSRLYSYWFNIRKHSNLKVWSIPDGTKFPGPGTDYQGPVPLDSGEIAADGVGDDRGPPPGTDEDVPLWRSVHECGTVTEYTAPH